MGTIPGAASTRPGSIAMDEQRPTGVATADGTASRGTCDECGQPAVLIEQFDPESPLSGSQQLCPSCARAPEPFWHDDR
jgi:hypothetical protein